MFLWLFSTFRPPGARARLAQAQACPNSRSVCKDLRCRGAIRRGELRLGKVAPSLCPSGFSRKVAWYHVDCLFEAFKRSSYVTKTLTDLSDLELVGDDLDALRDLVAYKIALHLADRANRKRKRGRVKEEEGGDSDVENRETWWTAGARWTTDVACCAAQDDGGRGSERPLAAAAPEPETCASPRGDDPDAESCQTWWTADALWTTDVACCAAQHDGGFEPPAAAAPETRASRQLAAARTQADADAAEAVSPRSVTHLFEDRLESLVI
ncbi:hypothetical protein M885DRAFT_50183 [Pelagophyceae sp. CCMP2097]|nr:hypothetical protein M885DRAFT_50183 [Pelagophyceae sp. CCMP2097]